MRTVFILRHAKSSWTQGVPDHARPLNQRGIEEAAQIGSILGKAEPKPQQIISSTAQRASHTARLSAEAACLEIDICYHDDLYHAPVERHIHHLAQLPSEVESVVLVAHNPGLEELLYHLTGDYESLQTATLAQVALPIERWDELYSHPRGTLVQIWRPRVH